MLVFFTVHERWERAVMALSLSGEEEEYDSESEQVWAFSLNPGCLRCVRFAKVKLMVFGEWIGVCLFSLRGLSGSWPLALCFSWGERKNRIVKGISYGNWAAKYVLYQHSGPLTFIALAAEKQHVLVKLDSRLLATIDPFVQQLPVECRFL